MRPLLSLMVLVSLAALPAAARPTGIDLEGPAALSLERTSLAGALEHLARDCGLWVVADGTPKRAEAPVLVRGTMREVLDAVGAAFGYRWWVARSGAVIMVKRFEERTDRPQVCPPEMAQAARDILTILPPAETDLADAHGRWGALLHELWAALTPEQKALLQQRGELAAVDMALPQRALFERVLMARLYGVSRAVFEVMAFQMANLDRSVVELFDPAPGAPPPPEGGRAYQIVLTTRGPGDSRFRDILGQLWRGRAEPGTPESGPGLEPQPAPAPDGSSATVPGGQKQPSPTDEARLARKVDLLLGSTTPGAVVQALSEQTGLAVSVQSCLRERRIAVCVAGLTARAAVDALAEMEDWAWRRTAVGRYELGRRPARRASAAGAALVAACRAALPVDVRLFLKLARYPDDERGGPAPVFPGPAGPNYDVQKDIGDLLVADLEKADTIPYARLSEPQRDALLIIVAFRRIQNAAGVLGGSDFGLRPGDPSRAVLQRDPAHPESLLVFIPGGGSFGVNVMLPRRP